MGRLLENLWSVYKGNLELALWPTYLKYASNWGGKAHETIREIKLRGVFPTYDESKKIILWKLNYN